MPKKTSRVGTAEKISTLLRIYRSAIRSGDELLRDGAAFQLKELGVDPELIESNRQSVVADESKGGAS